MEKVERKARVGNDLIMGEINTEDIPEDVVAWARGIKQKHAQSNSLTEYDSEGLVEKYLKGVGLDVKPISKSNSKTPDFEVHIKGKPRILVEVKQPTLIQDPISGLFLHKQTIPRIRRLIKTAHGQFESYDQNHKLIRVVAFTSTNFQQNWNTLANCIKGVVGGQKIIKDLRNHGAVIDTNEIVKSIDGFLWLQVDKKSMSIYQDVLFRNARLGNSYMRNIKAKSCIDFNQ